MDLARLNQTPPWEWPSNAGQTLLKILRDRRSAAPDRIMAAGLAGDLTVMDDRMADVLLSIVQNVDEPEQLRGRAAISLGPVLEQVDTQGFDDDLDEPPISEKMFHRIGETLQKVYADDRVPKEVRRRALEASVRAPQDWHPDAVRAAYSSQDEEWKLTAVFAMRWVPGFEAQILENIDSQNEDLQFESVRAAGNWEVEAAWPHIAALIRSEETDQALRLAAIEAAVTVNPREAESVLAPLLDSEDEEIAEAVDEALLQLSFEEGEEEEDEDTSYRA